MNVPLLDLKAQHATIQDEIREAVDRVVSSQYFILGPEVEALEAEIAAYTGARYGVGVASGSDAILLAMMQLGLGPGDAVVTTPYSFFATAGSITRTGASVIFVDIDPVTFNMDPGLFEDLMGRLTEKSKSPVTPDGAAVTGRDAGTPLRPDGRHGRHQTYRLPVRPLRGGRRRPGHRVAQPCGKRRRHGRHGVLFLFPQQEPRRLRRRRDDHDIVRTDRRRPEGPEKPRQQTEVLSPAGRRQQQARRAAGRGSEGKAQASGRLERKKKI